jgi:outer membrane protein
MKKILATLIIATGFNVAAFADFIGAEAGVGFWSSKVSGQMNYEGTNIDLEDDLGYGDSNSKVNLWASIEHPIPLFPNVRISKSSVSDSASGAITKDIDFGGTSFTASSNVSSNIQIDQIDATLYYELLDNIVSLDFGLNLKYLDGNAELVSGSKEEAHNFMSVIPMLHGKVGFDLPFSGFGAEVMMNYIGYDGNSISDLEANVKYESSFGLGAKIGLKKESIKADIDDFETDISISGINTAIFYHF